MVQYSETSLELFEDLGLPSDYSNTALELLERGESRFIRDLRVNVKNVLASDHLSEKETALTGLAIAVNQNNEALRQFFRNRASDLGATDAEIGEAVACTALLASNNVLYRFRHFSPKESYQQFPARIKMNIMRKPVLGKEFFELISLAVSAVNGCEMCVNAHEASLIELGSSEERIWDSVRLASTIVSLGKLIY